jgi:hypothetical protein
VNCLQCHCPGRRRLLRSTPSEDWKHNFTAPTGAVFYRDGSDGNRTSLARCGLGGFGALVLISGTFGVVGKVVFKIGLADNGAVINFGNPDPAGGDVPASGFVGTPKSGGGGIFANLTAAFSDVFFRFGCFALVNLPRSCGACCLSKRYILRCEAGVQYDGDFFIFISRPRFID